MTLLVFIHAFIALWLAAYGLNAFILIFLYVWHRPNPDPVSVNRSALPSVTVQVPTYNERHVIERVIDAVAALDYPHDKLQIQILDDSTDETTKLARERVAFHRERGVDIAVLKRPDRQGFKAGALAWGLARARGECIAIFDADFCPRPDFLLRTTPYFVNRPRLGLVQARWAHLNVDYSPLTRAQAMAFDGHFVVEQTGRNRAGLLMNFNGTAGVWRVDCIEDCGGWQDDTLSEDLDLSYRAQLAGWETLYLPDVGAPAELPPQMAAFKRQQSRWTQGSIQTLRKLFDPIMRSEQLTKAQKIMGLTHLSSYLAHGLMIFHLLISLPLLLSAAEPFSLGGLGLIGLGPPLVYVLSQRHLYPDWGRRLKALPLLVLVGIGIAWNNTRAIWRGLTRWGGTFARTPKFRLEGRLGGWADSMYKLNLSDSFLGEVALTIYALGAALVAYTNHHYEMLPFLLLYAASFGTVAGIEFFQIATQSQRRPSK